MVASTSHAASEEANFNASTVPLLRQDIEIMRSCPRHTGEPTWMLFDPIRNQYFRIGRAFFNLLSHWELATVDLVKSAVASKLKRPVTDEELSQFLKFLFTNQLTVGPSQDGYKTYFQKERAGQKNLFSTAMHSYLFFKIPLFRPDGILKATWPFVRFWFSRTGLFIFLVCAFLGLYLVSRQWSAFEDQFIAFLSLEGAFFYAFSLVFVKFCHEFGHGFMAHKYGLKVPIMGAAFLLLMPILYTDTSNAWRLPSRRQRLMIDCAGIMAELALASVATIFWVFLPDGLMRSAAFSVAAVSWFLSLLVNLNPFMRFDGYYILSDLLRVENLQSRGFALARWRLRELLFDLRIEPPERIEKGLQNALIFHAWGTWIYRFFLFLGIAFLVYTFFIKVVAIFLFVIEVLYFILWPTFREIKTWWELRSMIIKTKRTYVTAGLCLAALIAFFAPMSKSVSIGAVMHASNEQTFYPPVSGKLEELHVVAGSTVEPGHILAKFSSKDLALKIQLSKSKIELLEKRMNRSNADTQEKQNLRVLKSQLSGERDELENLHQQRIRLTIKSDRTGTVVNLDPAIHAGRYLGITTSMFKLKGLSSAQFTGAISEKHVDRVAVGTLGTFYPENLQLAPIEVRLDGIANTSLQSLSFQELSQSYGGKVPAHPNTSSSSDEKVSGSYYAVRLSLQAELGQTWGQTQRGTVILNATRVSYAQLTFERVLSILRRETGF